MKNLRYKINAYRIKKDYIPKEVYRYRIRSFIENINIYRFVGFYGGVALNQSEFILPYPVENLVLEYDGKDVKLEHIDTLNLEDIENKDKEKAEKLVRGYLTSIYKLKPILYKILRDVRESKIINDIRVDPIPDFTVKRHNNEYYLVIDFNHTATVLKNLWDFVGRDKLKLEDYIGKKIIFKPNPKKRYTIKSIEKQNKKDIDDIVEHIIEYYKWTEEEIKSTFGEIDYTQPIIHCEGIPYPFAPQFCNIVFTMEDLDENTLKDLQSYWRLPNEIKGNIINQIAKKLRFVENEPIELEFIKFNNTPLIVKDENGKPTKIYTTNRLFRWNYDSKSKLYLPYDIPDIIKNKTLTTFVLIDENLKNVSGKIKRKVYQMFKNYNKIASKTELPKFDFANKWKYFSNNNIRDVIRKIKDEFNEELGFALIIGNRYYENDYYETLKMQLFNLNIISQNILWENWSKDDNNFMTNNLLIQIMGKLGIKYFALDAKVNYDYIMGLDSGLGAFKSNRVSGCTVIYDSEGKIRRIQPIDVPSPGERIPIHLVVEFLETKTDINMENKNILFLRDGFVQNSEREELKKLSKELNSNIEVISIRKNNKYKVFTSDYGIGSIFGNDGIFLPHKTTFGSNPVKLSTWLRFNSGNEEKLKINESIMQLLYDLTKMNYSALYGEGRNLRIPAPIHYADKFVKALGKNWKIDEELLKHGFLYFI
ncbi:Piwi domain-containing protein [Methanocaldococcus fervens]|uniref:Stem cell self-renewal protein Piwi domain protein n=1 Tax=Methanocaldococcus fervens (strain DSM 4213 / JCM 15782 / AG86) TaxID=573064 RepID=C7P7E7_METFA|nr:Piwi domain-containing protein [Methanocaldococcus fervens]ACV24479.1 stem cell self-renewal protein Piwi domain protein [Methanocaldococcus fervens AG86]